MEEPTTKELQHIAVSKLAGHKRPGLSIYQYDNRWEVMFDRVEVTHEELARLREIKNGYNNEPILFDHGDE